MKVEHYSEGLLRLTRRRYRQEEGKPYGKPKGFWVSVPGKDDWPSWCRSEGGQNPFRDRDCSLSVGATIGWSGFQMVLWMGCRQRMHLGYFIIDRGGSNHYYRWGDASRNGVILIRFQILQIATMVGRTELRETSNGDLTGSNVLLGTGCSFMLLALVSRTSLVEAQLKTKITPFYLDAKLVFDMSEG